MEDDTISTKPGLRMVSYLPDAQVTLSEVLRAYLAEVTGLEVTLTKTSHWVKGCIDHFFNDEVDIGQMTSLIFFYCSPFLIGRTFASRT